MWLVKNDYKIKIDKDLFAVFLLLTVNINSKHRLLQPFSIGSGPCTITAFLTVRFYSLQTLQLPIYRGGVMRGQVVLTFQPTARTRVFPEPKSLPPGRGLCSAQLPGPRTRVCRRTSMSFCLAVAVFSQIRNPPVEERENS